MKRAIVTVACARLTAALQTLQARRGHGSGNETGGVVFRGPPAHCDELSELMPQTREACEAVADSLGWKFNDVTGHLGPDADTAPKCFHDDRYPEIEPMDQIRWNKDGMLVSKQTKVEAACVPDLSFHAATGATMQGPPARCDGVTSYMPTSRKECMEAAKALDMSFLDVKDSPALESDQQGPMCGYDDLDPDVVHWDEGGTADSTYVTEGHMGVCVPRQDDGEAVECARHAGTSLSSEEVKYAKCPPGNYTQVRRDSEQRLQAAICAAKARGYKSGNLREMTHYQERGYATFESLIWPKDPKCLKLIDEEFTQINDFHHEYRNDFAPDSIQRLVNEAYKLEFLTNWKVATTSFPKFLWCEYGDEWTFKDATEAANSDHKIIFSSRNPISRFVSAAGELIQRAVNRQCPMGHCNETDGFTQDVPDRWAHETTWYNIISAQAGGYTPDKIGALMAAFVSDTGCNYGYNAAEHFTSQATFATQNPGAASDIEAIVMLENTDGSDGDLKQFALASGKPLSNKCEMAKRNSNKDKPAALPVPSAEEMLAELEASDEVMKSLCLTYAQDFICFGYQLPQACQGMF